MSKPETITIDDVKYVRADSVHIKNNSGPKDIRIIVLPKSWNIIGEYTDKGDSCVISNASVIRIWGTTNGLGEIAKNGPTESTILDKCNGDVETLKKNIIMSIKCEHEKW